MYFNSELHQNLWLGFVRIHLFKTSVVFLPNVRLRFFVLVRASVVSYVEIVCHYLFLISPSFGASGKLMLRGCGSFFVSSYIYAHWSAPWLLIICRLCMENIKQTINMRRLVLL